MRCEVEQQHADAARDELDNAEVATLSAVEGMIAGGLFTVGGFAAIIVSGLAEAPSLGLATVGIVAGATAASGGIIGADSSYRAYKLAEKAEAKAQKLADEASNALCNCLTRTITASTDHGDLGDFETKLAEVEKAVEDAEAAVEEAQAEAAKAEEQMTEAENAMDNADSEGETSDAEAIA